MKQVLLLIGLVVLFSGPLSASPSHVVIVCGSKDIHGLIEQAPPYATLVFDRANPVVLDRPLVIDKPMTLRGIHARLPEDLTGSPLIFVTAEGFNITDFELHGNADALPDGAPRASLLVISAGNFVVRNGVLSMSTQHGVLIASSRYHRPQTFMKRYGGAGAGTESGIVENGVVRDLIIRSAARDGVSITGRNGLVRHILVENIRSYGGSARGAVEIADGSEYVTVRNVYAEDSAYAIDIMHDHGEQEQGALTEINKNHYAENIHAVRSRTVVRTRNRDLGHTGLTLRNITAEDCELPVQVSNVTGALIDGVRVINHNHSGPLLDISNVHGLEVRNVSLLNGNLEGPPVRIRNTTHARVEELLDARDR